MSSVGVQPEDSWAASCASAAHSKANPVPDRSILGLAHAPNIASTNLVLENNVAAVVGNRHRAVRRDLEGFVVRAILLSFLRHETHIAHIAHGGHVKLAVLLAVSDNFLIHSSITAVRDDALDVLQRVVLTPHLTTVTHHHRHGGVNDHIGRYVQVSNASARVNHGEPRALFITSIDILTNGIRSGSWKLLDLLKNIVKAVVRVHTNTLEFSAIFLEHGFKESHNDLSEDNGVRYLHHCRLHVKGEQHVVVLSVFNLGADEGLELIHVHAGCVNHFTGL
mmetsp:Transcript_102131/g.200291  ORF Transcript_102131/g.200291 Transcript_102131/m.200291 type:complete len:279 (-) Transcript_102131:773-1609(-)